MRTITRMLTLAGALLAGGLSLSGTPASAAAPQTVDALIAAVANEAPSAYARRSYRGRHYAARRVHYGRRGVYRGRYYGYRRAYYRPHRVYRRTYRRSYRRAYYGYGYPYYYAAPVVCRVRYSPYYGRRRVCYRRY